MCCFFFLFFCLFSDKHIFRKASAAGWALTLLFSSLPPARALTHRCPAGFPVSRSVFLAPRSVPPLIFISALFLSAVIGSKSSSFETEQCFLPSSPSPPRGSRLDLVKNNLPCGRTSGTFTQEISEQYCA